MAGNGRNFGQSLHVPRLWLGVRSADSFRRCKSRDAGLSKLLVTGPAKAQEVVSLGEGLCSPDERRVIYRRHGHGYDRSGAGSGRFALKRLIRERIRGWNSQLI